MGRRLFRLLLTTYKPGYQPKIFSLQRWACLRGKFILFPFPRSSLFSLRTGGAEDQTIKLLSILLIFSSITPVYAHLHGHDVEPDNPYNFKSPNDSVFFQAIEHLKENNRCGGYLRVGFIQTDHNSASAIGGEIGCEYQFNPYVKAHLGIFASYDPGTNSDDDFRIQDDFFNNKKDSYLILGEAVLTLSYAGLDAHLGRQHFDSPHIDGDDLRMIANLFEAYLIDYQYSETLSFGAGFVREAAGWENGANISQFVSIGEAFGGRSNGAWLSWVNYQQDSIATDAWFYYVADHLSIFYAELVHTGDFTENLSYSLSFQYDWGHDVGNARLGHINANTVGVMAAIAWTDFTFTAAYNHNFGHTGAIASVGGGPFFTSLEDQTLDAATGTDTRSYLLGIEYQLNEYIGLGSAYGQFNAANHREYNKEELNVFMNVSWKEHFNAELMYAVTNDKNSEPDMHQIRAILTYRF